MRRALLAGFVLVAAFGPRAAWPQAGVPLGSEFRVNTNTASNQLYPSVTASAGAGNFVVVWTSNLQDGSGLGVFGQRFAVSGVPLGPEFQVNTYTTGFQYLPSVASDISGNFVVTWISQGQDGSGQGVFGQRFFSTGPPAGPEFRVNTYTTGNQALPGAAVDPETGRFVVAWQSYGQDGSSWGAFAQIYSPLGVPSGAEFRVNTFTTGAQYAPSVAADGAGGNFAVVWDSSLQDGSGRGIFLQRFLFGGVPVGSEFRVNTYTTNNQYQARIAKALNGSFVVAWTSQLQDGSQLGVFGQRFLATGVPQGPEFQVNAYTPGYQRRPAVAADGFNNFVVTWASDPGQDGDSYGIFGQRFANNGPPQGPEFRINTYTTAGQNRPSVAANSAGLFVVTWDSQTQDGSGVGVYAQRFGQIVPVELLDFEID